MALEYKTKAKECIIEFLKKHEDKSFTAKDIYNEIVNSGNNINIATIYRNIDALVEKGQLLKTKDSQSDSTTYQYVEDPFECHHHLHIQCKNCGKIAHVDGKEFDELAYFIENKLGYTLECGQSKLLGFCKECSKKFMKLGV